MIINNTIFGVELTDIINELQTQLQINQIPLLQQTKDTPDNLMVSCPYHKGGQERRPSAGIKKSDGTFHCLACGETHTLPEMISFCFGYTNDMGGAFGWQWLLKNFLTVSVEERKDVVLDFLRSGNDSSKFNMDVYITEEELDSYRYIHQYMYKRKLTDEIIELFDIGYDKNTQCITFPIRDIKGNTLFIARRSVNSKFFNYPQGAEKPVYGLYEINSLCTHEPIYTNIIKPTFVNVITGYKDSYPSEVIICESMLDALTCWVYGKYAVALNGLGNELQFEQLNKMAVRKFVLATDMDEAGQKARKRIRKNIKGKLISEYIWDVHVAKDINDMSKEMFDNLEEIYG